MHTINRIECNGISTKTSQIHDIISIILAMDECAYGACFQPIIFSKYF